MNIQTNKVKSGNKIYYYARLVKSYRRSDGKPAVKVVANLGELPQREIQNLKLALRAARLGKAVVLSDSAAAKLLPVPVRANLEYLGIMVALQMWDEWNLPTLLDKIMPRQQDEVSPAAVVSALTAQRCVAPGPCRKMKSSGWGRTTSIRKP